MSSSRSAERLLRLYPRPWRERYGEEFLDTVGDDRLHPQQWIDIVSGAVDAWLSSEVRRALREETLARTGKPGGAHMTAKTMLACSNTRMRYTTRDALISAGVLLGVSLAFALLAIAAGRQGWATAETILQMLAFPGSVVISMPFAILKGQPWRAQATIIGVTLALLVAIAYVASLI